MEATDLVTGYPVEVPVVGLDTTQEGCGTMMTLNKWKALSYEQRKAWLRVDPLVQRRIMDGWPTIAEVASPVHVAPAKPFISELWSEGQVASAKPSVPGTAATVKNQKRAERIREALR